MNYNAPDHFSYNFKLNIDKIPAKQSDRIALRLLFPGLLSGLFLITLGIYELLHGARPETTTIQMPFWFNFTVFDGLIILLGAWIIIKLLLVYFQYKKVFFDGKKITMIYRSPFGTKTTVKESIKKYIGVRFRVEFFQYGLLNKNKYIIELYHDDAVKTAPLYIATSGHNIRTIWAEYAQKLKLPQVMSTEDDLSFRETPDIGKSLNQLYHEGVIKNTFSINQPLPSSISWVRKKDKTIIKSRKIRWDIFNILGLSGMGLLTLLLLFNIRILMQNWALLFAGLALFGFIVWFVVRLFTKDKLIIKPHKIIVVHKTMTFSRKKYELMKDDIETVDIAFSPLSERYFLAVIGGEKTLVFGKKLPVEDLEWIRGYLINDIVKK